MSRKRRFPAERSLCSAGPSSGSRTMKRGRSAFEAGLERPVGVDLIHRLPDVGEEPVVVELVVGGLLEIDHLGEQRRLREGEEGVDPGEAGRGEGHPLVPVEAVAFLLRDGREAVVGPAHVVVAVHLEDVAGLLVNHEAADDEFGEVAKLPEPVGPATPLDHPLHRHREGQVLDLEEPVDGQRVVHVEADHLDLVHPEVPVDEDLAGGGNVPAVGPRPVEDGADDRIEVGGVGAGKGPVSGLVVASSHPRGDSTGPRRGEGSLRRCRGVAGSTGGGLLAIPAPPGATPEVRPERRRAGRPARRAGEAPDAGGGGEGAAGRRARSPSKPGPKPLRRCLGCGLPLRRAGGSLSLVRAAAVTAPRRAGRPSTSAPSSSTPCRTACGSASCPIGSSRRSATTPSSGWGRATSARGSPASATSSST